MSKESRAAKLVKSQTYIDKYRRIIRKDGYLAAFKAGWKDEVTEFKAAPLWKKPLLIIRPLITIPIMLVLSLLIIIIAFVVGMVGFIIGLYIDYFWRMFAITCFIMAIIVLFAAGVF